MDLIDASLVNNNNDKTKKVGPHMCLYMLTGKEKERTRKIIGVYLIILQ